MRKAVRAIIVRDGQMLVMHRNKFGHEYYTLLGGGVIAGESEEQALRREMIEESGFVITKGRLVFVEEAGAPYGDQYIYLCEADGADPRLHPESEEAKIYELGQNLHTPMWIPVKDLPGLAFRSPELQQAIIFGLEHGFPEKPVVLDNEYLDKVQAKIAKKG